VCWLNALYEATAKHWEPTEVMVDFEVAIHNAVRRVWPKAHLRGCLFHHQQCVRCKLKGSVLPPLHTQHTAHSAAHIAHHTQRTAHSNLNTELDLKVADEVVEQIVIKTARVWRSPSIVQLQNNLVVVLPLLQALSAEFYAYYMQQWAGDDAVFPISEWGVCAHVDFDNADDTNNPIERKWGTPSLLCVVCHTIASTRTRTTLTHLVEVKRDAGEGKIGTVAGIRQLEKLHLSEYTLDVNQLSLRQSSVKPRVVKKKSTQDSWFAPSAADNKKVRSVLRSLLTAYRQLQRLWRTARHVSTHTHPTHHSHACMTRPHQYSVLQRPPRSLQPHRPLGSARNPLLRR
jgi:hypothetical protein